jgi:hypothetical protein
MSDLKVMYDSLNNAHDVLVSLMAEFDSLRGRVSADDSIWGHPAVSSAMDEFSGNMDYHRRQLKDKLKSCDDKVTATVASWQKADTELGKTLEDSRSQAHLRIKTGPGPR